MVREATRKSLEAQRKTRTVPVPRVDYADIRAGVKTEWRAYSSATAVGRAIGAKFQPGPAVGYCKRADDPSRHDTFLVFIEERWGEPMGAISEEGLKREGFSDMGEFRRYIEARYPARGFHPLGHAVVYRAHPLSAAEVEEAKDTLWEHLYGRWA